MSQLAVVVPPSLRALLARHGDIGRIRSTIGGFSNTTFSTTLDGHNVVVKANSDSDKRADLRREAAFLRFLNDTTIPSPFLRGMENDDEWTMLITDEIVGESGFNLAQRGDSEELRHGGRELGRLMSLVHTQPLSPLDISDALGLDVAARWLAARSEMGQLPELSSNVSLVHPALRSGMALIHGDAGLHNTLWSDGRLVALIDWEFAGFGNPLGDVAWAWWSLTFRRLPGAWGAFVDGYRADRLELLGWSADAIRELVRAQMMLLLSRTTPESSARKEWLRRIGSLHQLPTPSLD
jgi:aminoglycoside phosphotransferase (APT) family kinase protein